MSPLQLSSYQFRKIEIESQDDPTPECDNEIISEVEFEVSKVDPRLWRVALNVSLAAAEETTPRYLAKFKLEGIFRVHPHWPEDKIDRLVSANAPAVLFGAIREMVVNLTSRSVHGPIHLPTVRFPPKQLKLNQPSPAEAAKSS